MRDKQLMEEELQEQITKLSKKMQHSRDQKNKVKKKEDANERERERERERETR